MNMVAEGETEQTADPSRVLYDKAWNLLGSTLVWKAILWLCLWGFFVEIEFGTMFVIASIFFLVYRTLGDSKRNPGELSAYSVFNKGFKAIDGTLTAEQFDREIRAGPAAVRSNYNKNI